MGKIVFNKQKLIKFLKKPAGKNLIYLLIGLGLLYVVSTASTTPTTPTDVVGGGEQGGGQKQGGGGGGADLPNVPQITGPVKPVFEVAGFPRSIDIKITGESNNWIIEDRCLDMPPSEFDCMYIVGGHKFRQTTRLMNYPYQSNDTLRIIKMWVRKTASRIGEGLDNVHMQHHNCSASITIIVFTPA
jgi:hypothetical protein